MSQTFPKGLPGQFCPDRLPGPGQSSSDRLPGMEQSCPDRLPGRKTNQLNYLKTTVMKCVWKHQFGWYFHKPVDPIKEHGSLADPAS